MTYSAIMGDPQCCFVTDDGYMVCNFVVRHGIEIRSKSGKWMKWFVGYRPKKKTSRVAGRHSSKRRKKA